MKVYNSKLIMVEGIPGSGKSTLSKLIHEHLSGSGIKTTLYNEGSHNPLDLFWYAYLTKEEFNQILFKYNNMSKEINNHSIFENNYVLVPYKKLNYKSSESDLEKYLKEREICYSNKPLISLEKFKEVYLKRWYRFREANIDRKEITIFESTFFQHNIHDLMRLYAPKNKEIIEYLYSLIQEVVDFKPILIYLTQSSVEETLTRVWEERNKNKNSFKFVENSKYGEINNLIGRNGAIKFWKDRKSIEFEAMSILPIKIFVIDNSDYNWEKVFYNIIHILK